jgi:DNA-3-methyladenine glycosylase II
MTFELAARGPLDFALSCYRYHVWGEDLANRYRDGCFRRVTAIGGHLWLYEVAARPAGDGVRVSVLASASEEARGETQDVPEAVATGIGREVAGLFSLEEDLEAFYHFAAARDPTLAALCRALCGYRVTRAPGLFEALVTSITAQQINLPFAFTVRNRLIRAYGRTLAHAGETYYAFPEPAAIAAAAPEALRAMQFSTRKAAYIIELARVMAEGTLTEAELRKLPNEAVLQRLCALTGIGRWTAEWALIRALGRGDVIPADDLGVQQAAARFYFDGRRPSAAEVRQLAERWHPWETHATYYLLAGLRLRAEEVAAYDRDALTGEDVNVDVDWATGKRFPR